MAMVTYICHGDYLLPDIKLNAPPSAEPLGQYARARRSFLREHRPMLYNALLLSERLFPHLRDVDGIALERQRRGVSAEIILTELVYD